MSAEQSRLRSAIQRIAKDDPDLRGAIDAAKSRGDQPGGLGVGESDGERDRICCDGSTSDSANPGVDSRDPNESAKDGLDPDDPADVSDNLAGVVDCEAGQPICFEGSDYIPKGDGSLEGWAEGYYWIAAQASGYGDGYQSFLRCADARSYAIAHIPCEAPGDCSGAGMSTGIACPDGSQYQFSYARVLCGSTSSTLHPPLSGECEYTSDNPPSPTEWPSDGCVNLAIISGSIVGSKYDPENDGSYSAPRDEIELCDGDNSILIRPSADGGWKSIQSLAGEPDGAVDYGYLYAPDGKRIRQISPSEFRDDMV